MHKRWTKLIKPIIHIPPFSQEKVHAGSVNELYEDLRQYKISPQNHLNHPNNNIGNMSDP